jgi:Tfp pilus assembly protein PilX
LMEKRGFALVFSMLIIVVLLTLGAATFSRTAADNLITQKYLDTTEAFWLAEAGIQKGIWQVKQGSWSGEVQSLGAGFYNVTVSEAAGVTTVTSYGNSGGIQRIVEVEIIAQSPFTYAAFGKSSVTVDGDGITDSYDSSKGAYGGVNRDSNGDVGTLATTAAAIALSGNADVYGDADTGPGGRVTENGNAELHGTHDDTNTVDKWPSVSIPAYLTNTEDPNLEVYENLTVSGDNAKTINAGNYQARSIDVSGNGILYIDGEVNIYLTSTATSFSTSGNGKLVLNSGASVNIYMDGKASISGNGVVNSDRVPADFMVNSTYSGTNGVTISGNGDLHGAIYAPDAQIKVTGNGDVFGTLVGGTLDIPGNGEIHYDEALAELGGNAPEYVWKELQNPYHLE